ncbi:nucleoprotein TPR isoform X1 [Atheta coriaria]|uniref:nucleoprotein TPR isoform X1 n=1 Tax=Dalotia coriaria TaxID=877792 RepID=UPI0031F3E8DF
MGDISGREVLRAAFSEKEWRRVPSEIAQKLETYIGSKFDELITSKALQETKSYNAVHNLADLQGKHEALCQEHEKINKKLDHANNTITELENQLANSVADVGKLQTNCNRLESDLNELRSQRNNLLTEKEEVSRMVERRTSELDRMQCELKALTKQLEESVSAKCDALSKINEVDSMKFAIEYKEKQMEQEKALMKSQIMMLTRDLEARTNELLLMRRDNSSRCVQLDIKLSERTQELANANENIKQLTEKNTTLNSKTEELVAKMGLEKENFIKTLEAYQTEVEAQKQIAELYKNVSEQQTKHSNELTTAMHELREKLDDALEKYGDLETKYREAELAHEEILSKKTEYITMLKRELETANDLITNRPTDIPTDDDESLPKMKSGMSFTEIYSRYVQVTEQVAQERAENKRLHQYIQSIIQELEHKGPLVAKQREHYEKAMDSIEDLTKQVERLSAENQQMKEVSSDLRRSAVSYERENIRLKREVSDLSRQVCHLLKEVEMSRTGSSITSMDHDRSDSTCSADIITKRLVTFSDISDLQSTNARLLALVRELSTKQEEADAMDPEMIIEMKDKLDKMREQHASLLEDQEKQNSMVKMLMEQRDTYKGLYHQFLKGNGDTLNGEKSPTSKNNDDSDIQSDEKYLELEQAVQQKSKDLTLLKEELDTYKVEKAINEKMILEQSEKLRAELQEMMRQNTKMGAKCETNDEMIRVLKNNADVYKSQIERLEDRIRIYSESIVKHEASQQFLKDQVMEAQTKLSKIEGQLAGAQKENMLLRDSEMRIKCERDHLLREQQSNTTMFANIELIKATLERNDAESKMRLEDILKEAHRECAALRRRLQEEQDRFRELGDNLKKKTEAAQKRMEEEKSIADTLREDLNQARENISVKSQQLEELSKRLKNPILDDLEVSVERRKIRELEQNLFDAQANIDALTQKLKISKDAVEQHRNVAVAAETQLKDLSQKFVMDKNTYESQIAALQKKIEELEEKNAELQGELSLQSDGQVNVTSNLHTRLSQLEVQNKVLNDDLLTTKSTLDDAKEHIKQLQDNVNLAENKYIQEMKSRSEDLQTLTAIKGERVKLLDELNEIKANRDRLQDSLDESRISWDNQEAIYKKAKEELETRSDELNKQNSLLLNQLEALNEQMTLLHTKISDPNRSFGADSSMNKSFNEDESKSSDQLVTVIKYLRREKDLAINKCEILAAEHNRICAEQESLKRQYEDAKKALESERQDSEVAIVTAARHAEVLRKVETLNALTDSNRSLRAERDTLMAELEELKKRTSMLEEQLSPLQEKNNELQKKAEAMQTENITLRNDATRWRQRANILLEKSNRTSPEDWKKLQHERETLAKQLTIERGNTAKLTDENANLRGDNSRFAEQLRQLSIQFETSHTETMKLNEELTLLRNQVTALSNDFDQAKVKNISITEENRRLNENIANKDTAINDVKNSMSQIRKIAKKYKTQAEDLQKEIEVLKQQAQQNETGSNVSDEKREEILQEGRSQIESRISQLEQTHTERINELNVQVHSSQEEFERNRKEIESLNEKLSSSHEKEERFKVLFKNAKDRIVALTEQNASLKAQMENRDDGGSSQQGSSGDNPDLQRCLKEKEQLMSDNQQDKERLLREIETLTQRVNQLQRQLGLQQGSKPSTSSEKEKSVTEPPTANIKPMAGHSTNTQTQSVPIQPWRSVNEPPLASIRPMSQQRTAAVLPTSQSPSTVMVPPQQQVHTTGNSGIEAMSSSPTSSHTDYVPATSSANLLGPRQVAVPPTQSNQDNEDDDSNMQVQQVQQQQVVAMVLPRVEPPSPAQEQGTSSSSSSNTVTTTQAGLKRPRETASSDGGEDSKTNQQPKRTRIVQGTSSSGAEGSVSESGLEVEYQVPTSSQRDHEEDAVIVVESDEEGPDEGEGEDYNMPYEDADQDDEGGNEVEVIEDSSEVPNQSERGETDMQPDGDDEEECDVAEERVEEEEAMNPEATSSGTNISTSVAVTLPSFSRTRVVPLARQQGNLVVLPVSGEVGEDEKAMQPEATSSGTNVSTSVAVTLPSFSRTRVAPLARSQQGNLVLPVMGDEGGDDGIVPSTPTLATARRCDGFGEAVSSPHVPSGRFTFMESTAPNTASNDVLPEQTLEMTHADDNSTGRSVPNTPLQTSPHESGPSSEEQPSHHQVEGTIPSITISGAEDEVEAAESGDCMGPPSVAGTSTDGSQHTEHQSEEIQEGEDGVSSEGEKAASTEEGEEEGREAEASPSTNTRSRHQRGPAQAARRGVRGQHVRGVARPGPQPIVWVDPHSEMQRQGNMMSQQMHRGRGANIMNFSPRTARRSRGRQQRGNYTGRY